MSASTEATSGEVVSASRARESTVSVVTGTVRGPSTRSKLPGGSVRSTSAIAASLALDRVSSSPPTGWKIDFQPKEIPEIGAGEEKQVTALLTPPAKAINGDYMLTMRASGDGISESATYRVTVMTSTLWGVTGIAVIGAALLILVGAVGRFGRR